MPFNVNRISKHSAVLISNYYCHHYNCPKHVEFLDKNKFGKIIASVGFIKTFILYTTTISSTVQERWSTISVPFSHFLFNIYIHSFTIDSVQSTQFFPNILSAQETLPIERCTGREELTVGSRFLPRGKWLCDNAKRTEIIKPNMKLNAKYPK